MKTELDQLGIRRSGIGVGIVEGSAIYNGHADHMIIVFDSLVSQKIRLHSWF
jgi:hypothetical protein